MWVLESDGDAFEGKRLWLRPGKKFLLGRAAADTGHFVITDKTISRKHVTVEVSTVGLVDCPNLRTRSKVTIEDLNTKIGTLVNGEQIRGTKYELKQDQNVVVLGKYKHNFTFTWIPVTFTFSFTSKELKANPYTSLHERFGALDIKVISDYVRGHTTHVVAKKRNTSKGLQALIHGMYIVHNDGFLKAIEEATTSAEEDGVEQSPLELDWDTNFPDPLKYLPPKGDEPTKRDPDAYAPNLARKELFEGYTFIFYEKRQFETLLAPITDGRGKALLRSVIPEQTEVDEFVGYVKSVAGEKGSGEFEDGSEGKGVVVVRFNPVKGAGTDWYADFNRMVSLHLDHRLVEQNEFLDAILGVDPSVLRRPLEEEQSGVMAPPSTAVTVVSQAAQVSQPVPTPQPSQSAPAEPSQPARRGRSRRTVTTKFKGFDSDEDTPMNMNSVAEEPAVVQGRFVVESQSQSLFVTQDPNMEIHRAPSEQPETQTRSSRKRNSPPVNYEPDEPEDILQDTLEDMAPTATKFKKRRLADEAARRKRGESIPPPLASKDKPVIKPEPIKKAKKEIDVVEVARKKRKEADELARAEREVLESKLDGMDIEAIRNLTIVEEMPIRTREPQQRATRADESDRWDDRWNGRKNFKKFRHRGEVGPRRDLGRVIVPLEEAKKKDYGIGDDYWLHEESAPKTKKDKSKNRDTQDTQTQSQTSRPKNRASTLAAEMLVRESTEDALDDEIHANVPPSSDVEIIDSPPPAPVSRLTSLSKKLADKSNMVSNVQPRNKRAAETTLSKPAPAKKARQAAVVQDSDDSDDGLKFRFRKKK